MDNLLSKNIEKVWPGIKQGKMSVIDSPRRPRRVNVRFLSRLLSPVSVLSPEVSKQLRFTSEVFKQLCSPHSFASEVFKQFGSPLSFTSEVFKQLCSPHSFTSEGVKQLGSPHSHQRFVSRYAHLIHSPQRFLISSAHIIQLYIYGKGEKEALNII